MINSFFKWNEKYGNIRKGEPSKLADNRNMVQMSMIIQVIIPKV